MPGDEGTADEVVSRAPEMGRFRGAASAFTDKEFFEVLDDSFQKVVLIHLQGQHVLRQKAGSYWLCLVEGVPSQLPGLCGCSWPGTSRGTHFPVCSNGPEAGPYSTE